MYATLLEFAVHFSHDGRLLQLLFWAAGTEEVRTEWLVDVGASPRAVKRYGHA